MKCPCEDCLCVPICRHKRYIPLIKCSILKDYLMKPSEKKPVDKINEAFKILAPTRWVHRRRKVKGKNRSMISITSKQNEK